ncbi:hypothetical protein GIS00_08915 [Nakamurella sp. YIM 132087]|uniref:SnoaL-like domain-containing protein n=2 Tax=Nakamurella alba TaxID=2665158 RepID=A0A7K1FMQ6_9ACTN|nr:hypothetical protein [Nakamurella alba]
MAARARVSARVSRPNSAIGVGSISGRSARHWSSIVRTGASASVGALAGVSVTALRARRSSTTRPFLQISFHVERTVAHSFDMEQLRTTSGTDPAGVVHRLYRALAVGDIDAAAATLTDDTVLHVPGTGINVGTWTGRAGVLDFVQKAAETTAGTLRLTLHRAFADDEWAVGLATYTATRPGREVVLENHLAHVMRLRGGLIAEGWLQARDQYAVDAFWAR